MLSLVGAAAVALSASSAEAAECSDGSRTALELATIFSGVIPEVGTAASAGFALSGMLLCDDGQSLDEGEIVDLIREQASDDAADVAALHLPLVTAKMLDIADVLEAAGDTDLAALDIGTRNWIRTQISIIGGDLDTITTALVVPLSNPVNSRMSYDLSPALTFAHYRLALASLGAQIDGATNTDAAVVESVLEHIEAYRAESDRLRGISIGDVDPNPGIKSIADVVIPATVSHASFRRSGAGFGGTVAIKLDETHTFEDIVFAFDYPREFALHQHTAPLFRELDAQDAQLALLQSRAHAMVEDPFADFASVAAIPETPVMLKNIHPNSKNRCLFNRVGYLDLDGELQSGATRMRGCVPADSQQQWLLRDNGQIRSSIAELCLTAKADNKVLVEPCSDVNVRQLWTRDGNRFKVQIAGEVTCLAPGIGGLNSPDIVARHMTCDDAVLQQEWLMFSQLRSGRPFQVGAASVVELLDVDGLDALTDALQEEAEGGLCLDSSATLRACDRLDADLLWAEDAQGRLQPFDLDRRPLSFNPNLPDEVSTDFGLSEADLVNENVEPFYFERFEVGPGFVTFAVQGTNELLFPGAVEEGSGLFKGPVATDENGAPVLIEDVFWRHFNGGKLAS